MASQQSDRSSPARQLPPAPDAVVDKLRALAAPDAAAAGAAAADGEPDARHLLSGALFARLKALNRAANAAARTHKQATADARQDMDQTHLGLQNLLYEKRHLEREIEKCRQFASIYQDIPLYAPEEFVQLAPEDMRTEEILADEHKLMLARLNFELVERQRLEARRKALSQQKDELLKQSKSKQTTTDTVKAQLDLLYKTAMDIQKKVDDLVPSLPEVVEKDSPTTPTA